MSHVPVIPRRGVAGLGQEAPRTVRTVGRFQSADAIRVKVFGQIAPLKVDAVHGQIPEFFLLDNRQGY